MRAIRLLYAANVIHHRDGAARQSLDFRLLVENRAYEKTVEIHWAGEDGHWRVLPAAFVGQLPWQDEIWHAHAEYPTTEDHNGQLPGDIAFAIRHCSAGREDWDNNHGANFEINADAGLRLADSVHVLPIDYRPCLHPGQEFLPITVATHTMLPPNRVFVRWSTDGWRTRKDSDCYSLHRHCHATMGSAARNPNRYGTRIWVTRLSIRDAYRVEYTLACETPTGIHWDNNLGHNYLARQAPLRVLTLNLHCCQEENQDAKLSLIAQAIRDLDIDIICLQEVAEPWNGGQGDWNANTANLIRERIGRPYHVHFDWSHIGFGRYRESCAILSRFEFARTDSAYVSSGRDPYDIHSRKAVMAQVHVPYMGTVNVISAHLSWWDAGFMDQFTRLRQWVAASQSDEVAASLVCGDFNNATHSPGYALMTQGSDLVDQFAAALLRAGHADKGAPPAPPHAVIPDPNRIDYLFLHRGDRLAAVAARELFTDAVYGRVSDHPGYLVEFEPV